MGCLVSTSAGAGVENRLYALWISVSCVEVRLFSLASLETRFFGSAGAVDGGGRRFGGCLLLVRRGIAGKEILTIVIAGALFVGEAIGSISVMSVNSCD